MPPMDTSHGFRYILVEILSQVMWMQACSCVLFDLMSGVGEGFHLYTDNYYTGPVAYKALYDQGINCYGTVRTNIS